MTYWWFLPLYNETQIAAYCCLIPFSFGTSRYIHMCVWRQPWLLNRSHIKLLLHTFSDPFGPSHPSPADVVIEVSCGHHKRRICRHHERNCFCLWTVGSRTGHRFRLMSLLICWCSYSLGLDKVNRLKGGGLLTKLAQIKISFAVNR